MRREFKIKLKEARRDKKLIIEKDLIEALEVINHRQLVLRNIMNTLVLAAVGGKGWVARSMVGDDLRIPNVDPTSLRRHLEVASKMNKISRHKFCIVSDMTTCVDYGDFIEIDPLSSGDKWKIIEHKDGKVNHRLLEIIEANELPLDFSDDASIEHKMSDGEVDQARRIIKQEKRREEMNTLIKTNISDHATHEIPRALTPDEIEIETYEQMLVDMFKRSYEKPLQIETIDECLHIAVVTQDLLDKIGGVGSIAHLFFHKVNPSVECLLNKSKEDAMREFNLIKEIQPIVQPIFNNLSQKRSEPFFRWVDPVAPYTLDVLSGRIRFFAYFDIKHFENMVEKSGLKLEWLTKKESEEIKKHSQKIPGTPDSYGFKIIHPGGVDLTYMAGFLFRVILYYFKPSSLIKMMEQDPIQMKKLDEQVQKEES